MNLGIGDTYWIPTIFRLKKSEVILKLAQAFKSYWSNSTIPLEICKQYTVANVFFENSTRTRISFELAAKRLGAQVVNLDVANSSVAKGETMLDTARTLASMGVDLLVQRHPTNGSAHSLAKELGNCLHIANAGDGSNAHPYSSALLDLFTMQQTVGNIKGKNSSHRR